MWSRFQFVLFYYSIGSDLLLFVGVVQFLHDHLLHHWNPVIMIRIALASGVTEKQIQQIWGIFHII